MFVGEKPDLLDFWVFREDLIYVVGKDGIPQVFDGKIWSRVETENRNPLMGIWASSENDIYTAGIGGIVLRYDGDKWNQVDTGNFDSLNAIYGYDANHVFIFGVGGRVLFWNGTGWEYREPNTIHDLFCFWGERQRPCKIDPKLGEKQQQQKSTCGCLFLHWLLTAGDKKKSSRKFG